MKNFILLIVCASSITFNTYAKVYRVSSPDEFGHVVAALATPGDEIMIADGNYNNWEQVVNTNGTSEKPIIIRAETPGKVIFSGDVHQPVFLLTGSFTEISGIKFTGCNVYKSATENGVLIELKDTNHCRIQGMLLKRNSHPLLSYLVRASITV